MGRWSEVEARWPGGGGRFRDMEASWLGGGGVRT